MGVTIFRPGQRVVIPSPGVQVWSPRVAAAAAASGVLDGISNVAAAYSLRKLRSAYAGSAVRVRRSSDSTEQDIGFDGGGEFDSAAFSAFVGGGSGFVKTWYDQSGNGRDATQTTAQSQPSIALSAVNSKPALTFDGSNDVLTTATSFGTNASLSGNPAFTTICVAQKSNNALGNLFGWGNTGVGLQSAGYVDGTSGLRAFAYAGNQNFMMTAPSNTTWYVHSYKKLAGAINTTSEIYRNGTSAASTGHATTTPAISGTEALAIGRFANYSVDAFAGNMTDLIILNVAISTTNHNTIGADMATRYGLSWTTVT